MAVRSILDNVKLKRDTRYGGEQRHSQYPYLATCRLCMRNDFDTRISIFDFLTDQRAHVDEIVATLSGVHISHNDDGPKGLCTNCLDEMVRAYAFRQKCQRSDDILKKKIPWDHAKKDELKMVEGVELKQPPALRTINLPHYKYNVPIGSSKMIIKKIRFVPSLKLSKIVKISDTQPPQDFLDEKTDKINAISLKKDWKSSDSSSQSLETQNVQTTESSLLCTTQSQETQEGQKKESYLDCSIESQEAREGQKKESYPDCSTNSMENQDSHTPKSHRPMCIFPSRVVENYLQTKIALHNETVESDSDPLADDNLSANHQPVQITTPPKPTSWYGKPPNRFMCEHCGFQCHVRAAFLDHQNIHGDEKKFKCQLCPYASKTMQNMYTHAKKHKRGKGPEFVCDLCGKSLRSKCSLVYHMLAHNGEKKFKCTKCDYRALLKTTIKQHMAVHETVNKFKCFICSHALKTKANLAKHMKTHTVPSRNYTCRRCNADFFTASSLGGHVRKCVRSSSARSKSTPRRRKVKSSASEIDTSAVKIEESWEDNLTFGMPFFIPK